MSHISGASGEPLSERECAWQCPHLVERPSDNTDAARLNCQLRTSSICGTAVWHCENLRLGCFNFRELTMRFSELYTARSSSSQARLQRLAQHIANVPHVHFCVSKVNGIDVAVQHMRAW